MKKSKLSKFSKFFGLIYSVSLILFFTNGGLNSPHKGIGLVLMACAGFFAGLLLIHLAALWFVINNRTMNLTEMNLKNSGTANVEGENEKTENVKKTKFLNISKRTGIIYSGLLILACAVVGLNTPHSELGLGLMACAGFFTCVLLIVAVAKPSFFDKPLSNESNIDYSMKM